LRARADPATMACKVRLIQIAEGERSMIKTGWIALALLGLAAGCTQHPPGWDDAWAACQAEAIEQMEFADPDRDQRSEWQENYIRECMDKKGFEEPSTI
jgi:hypothetical protein